MSLRSGLAVRADAVAQFLVRDLHSPELDKSDLHHLVNVLRVRPGEDVSLVDGSGGWLIARWTGSELTPSTDCVDEASSGPSVSIGFSLLKGEKNEWVVQKLTELGVDVIVPVRSRRTIVKWDPKKEARNLERLQRVAHEAAMQSRRVRLPEIRSTIGFEQAVAEGMIPAHPGGEPLTMATPAVLIGPEGGWDPEELVLTQRTVDLGPTILRAETASIAVGGILCALRAS